MLASHDTSCVSCFCHVLACAPFPGTSCNDGSSCDGRGAVARGADDAILMCDLGVLLLDFSISSCSGLSPIRRPASGAPGGRPAGRADGGTLTGSDAMKARAEAGGGGRRDNRGPPAGDGQLMLLEPVLDAFQAAMYMIVRFSCQWLEAYAKAGGPSRGVLLGPLLEQGKLLRWLSWLEVLDKRDAQALLQMALTLISPTPAAPEPPFGTSCAEGDDWPLSQRQAHQVGPPLTPAGKRGMTGRCLRGRRTRWGPSAVTVVWASKPCNSLQHLRSLYEGGQLGSLVQITNNFTGRT